jgi:hypothetical protein
MNKITPIIICIFCLFKTVTFAQEKTAASAAELAKKLANPVASLISVPFQNNLDVGIGAFNGWRNTLNFQPVIPIKLNAKVNLITRMVLPIISQNNITGEGSSQSGLSDALISAFLFRICNFIKMGRIGV